MMQAVQKRNRPFFSYSNYLNQKYGGSVYRISVDAGFSCPNRGPDRTAPGCLYCDEHGSRAPYLGSILESDPGHRETDGKTEWRQDLRTQIDQSRQFLHSRYGAQLYILYFQAFSGTYASVEKLRRVYDFALNQDRFQELAVSTRPDCIDQPKAELLATYRRRDFDVWVELGLQSANEQTLQRINRGHTVSDFERAYRICQDRGLKVAVHLIFGLPGEGLGEIRRTIDYVAALRPEGVKIHNLHISKGCPLYAEYLSGELTVPCDRRHLEYTIQALELLPPETVIMRLTCDTPEQMLAAPRHFSPKARFLSTLHRELEARDTWQGRLFSLSSNRRPPA
jgi:radical SAM protein (TIGR01212 family)